MATRLFPVYVVNEGDQYVAWPATILMACSAWDTEESALDMVRARIALYFARCEAAGKEPELFPAYQKPDDAELRWVQVAL